MGLLSGMMLGTVVGIALVAVWREMMKYRAAKRISKAGDIKLLGSLNREDLRKICGDSFPEWISFPAYEQVKWLNKHLSKMWPYIDEATKLVIGESVEPMLEDYRPPGISTLKFDKFSLGTVAPKIEGIRVQSLKKGQIIMDIDFRWGGNPNIILAVEALVASLPIQLKDLQIFTIIRVIFQLSENIPCISAVLVALLAEPEPRIDYTLKAVGGSLTAIPGLSDMIDETVKSIVNDTLKWPRRIVVPLGGVPDNASELELKPQGRLLVTVLRATALKNMEFIGKSDPYVVLYIRPLHKYKTKVIDDNLSPEWNETFQLIVEDKETQYITFEVFDKDVTQDARLGVVKLPLKDLGPVAQDMELRLLPAFDMLKIKDKKDRGTITLKVHYHEFTPEEQREAHEAEKRWAEERRKLKESGVIGGTVGAVGGAVGAGVELVGSGVVAGAGIVGSGIGAGVGAVGTGFGSVGSGLSKAGKFMGKSLTGTFKSKSGSGSPSPKTPGSKGES